MVYNHHIMKSWRFGNACFSSPHDPKAFFVCLRTIITLRKASILEIIGKWDETEAL
jgi:hypothetical protein